MNEGFGEEGTSEGPFGHGWRPVVEVALGLAALGMLLACENLWASTILSVSRRYPGIDKVAHVVQYAGVFFAVWWLLGTAVPKPGPRAALAAALAMLLGTNDEVLQRFVADRRFDLTDLAANAVGIMLGLGLAPLVASAERAGTGRREAVRLPWRARK